MDLFNEAWRCVRRSTLLKCWVKSKCLSENKTEDASDILAVLIHTDEPMIDMTVSSSTAQTASDSTNVILGKSTAKSLHREIRLVSSREYGLPLQTSLNDLLGKISKIEDVAQLMAVMNSPAPFDDEPTSAEVASQQLQNLFESSLTKDMSVQTNQSGQDTIVG